jgi:hypothetical protein
MKYAIMDIKDIYGDGSVFVLKQNRYYSILFMLCDHARQCGLENLILLSQKRVDQ